MWKRYLGHPVWRQYTGFAREAFLYITYPFRSKHNPTTKFLIFTIGRSGSSLLVDLLNSHPEIHCDNELLERKLIFPKRYIKYRETVAMRDVYGFKLNTYHFDVQKIKSPISFVSELHATGYKIISLKRRNLLRQSISHLYALHRYKFHQRKSRGEQKHMRMQIDIEKLGRDLNFFSDHNEIEDNILTYFPYYRIYYEDDLQDEKCHQSTVDRITDYLEISKFNVCTDYTKTTPTNLSSIIDNLDDVFDFVRKTEYAKYLEME
jgi:hypothetical protein